MKKQFMIFFLLLVTLFLLASCVDQETSTADVGTTIIDEEPIPSEVEQTVDTDEPVITTEPVYEYILDAFNFESFFKIESRTYKNDYGYNSEIIVKKIDEFETKNISFILVIYVEYYAGLKRNVFEYAFSINDFNTELIDTMRLDFLGNIRDVSIYYIEVGSATGTISSLNNIEVINKTYELPLFDEHKQSIIIKDQELNNHNYNELMMLFDSLESIDSNYLAYYQMINTTVKTNTEVINNTESRLIKIDIDDFYYEFIINDESYVILENQGKLFLYHIKQSNYFNNKFYVNPEVISNLSDFEFIDDDEDFLDVRNQIDKNKMLITNTGYSIKVESKLVDALSEDDYLFFEAIYMALGVSEEVLRNLIITTEFMIQDQAFVVFSMLYIPVEYQNLLSIEVSTIEIYSFEAFEKINLFDESSYYIYQADEFDEVIDFTDTSEFVTSTQRPLPRHFYYTYLEGGQYLIHDRDNSLRFEIYDVDRNIVNAKHLNIITNNDKYIFVSEGYYYIEVKGRTSAAYSGYSFKFEKLNYNSIYNSMENEYLIIGENVIEIEGSHDFKRLIFTATQPTLLEISLESGSIMFFYNHPQISGYNTYHPNIYNKIYVEMMTGTHEFIFSSSDANISIIDIALIDVSNHKSNIIDDMAYMTDQFNQEFVFVSEILGQSYFKMDILEKSFVSFKFSKYNNLHTPSISILDENFEFDSYNSFYTETQGIVLDSGTYILRISSNMAAGGQMHYVLKPYVDINLDITLSSFDSIEPFNINFPYFEVLLFDKDHHAYLNFTIEEESIVYLKGAQYEIFTSDHQRVGIMSRVISNFGDYLLLDAGNYYLKLYNTENYNRTIKVLFGVITDEISDDNFHGSIINQIELGFSSFTKDNNYDRELVKIEISTSKVYNINTSRTIFIYDQNGAFIRNIFDNTNIYLEVGTYYIEMPDYQNRTVWNLNFN
jgi:hypothetical protein